MSYFVKGATKLIPISWEEYILLCKMMETPGVVIVNER